MKLKRRKHIILLRERAAPASAGGGGVGGRGKGGPRGFFRKGADAPAGAPLQKKEVPSVKSSTPYTKRRKNHKTQNSEKDEGNEKRDREGS